MPFRLPTRVHIAPGSLSRAPDIARQMGLAHVLVVVDQGLQQTPWPRHLCTALEQKGLTVTVVDTIAPNPRHTTIDALADEARQDRTDGVIGLGGGSVLDAAKAIAMLLHNPGSSVDYEGKNRFSHPAAPFLAIPTTCGTGSEVTWVSVITHTAQQRKLSVKGDGMFPTAALVDADLLATLPPHLVVSTGLDALTHALEAYTGTARNPVSDALAEKAIVLLFTYLTRAYRDITGDAEAREAVMRASTLAGMAFGNADVGGVHCLSETIGGIWDVPHGLCNAMLLLPVMRYHLPHITERLARLYALTKTPQGTLNEKEAAHAFLDGLEDLINTLDLPPFSSLEIDPVDYPLIATGSVANNSNSSNPQPMLAGHYLDILNGL